MAVKIRLTRRGRKKLARFDLIVADARSPRDGRFIEKIGAYNPQTNPATIDINEEKALDWLLKGAQPTDTARRILSYKGVLMKKHLQVGVMKGAVTQEDADRRFEDWKNSKEEKIAGKVDTLSKKKAESDKARLAAETKVKEAKAEALRKKMAVEEPVAEVAETEENAPETQEAVAEETKAKAVEAPKAEETKTEDAVTPKAEEPKKEETKAEAVEAPKAEETKTEDAATPKAEEPKKEEAKVETVKEEPKAAAEEKPKVEAKAETVEEAPQAEQAEAPKQEEPKAGKVETPKAEKEETDSSEETKEDKK